MVNLNVHIQYVVDALEKRCLEHYGVRVPLSLSRMRNEDIVFNQLNDNMNSEILIALI